MKHFLSLAYKILNQENIMLNRVKWEFVWSHFKFVHIHWILNCAHALHVVICSGKGSGAQYGQRKGVELKHAFAHAMLKQVLKDAGMEVPNIEKQGSIYAIKQEVMVCTNSNRKSPKYKEHLPTSSIIWSYTWNTFLHLLLYGVIISAYHHL